MSEEALQIAEKRKEAKGKEEKEIYTELNTGFQRRARRDKKIFLSEQCKEIEESNRMGKTRDPLKKMRGAKEHFMQSESESEVAQSYLTLCDPMDCSLPGSSFHGIFQARVLEWVAISFSKMDTVKDRNYMDLTEAEDIKRWQEYTEELHKKIS